MAKGRLPIIAASLESVRIVLHLSSSDLLFLRVASAFQIQVLLSLENSVSGHFGQTAVFYLFAVFNMRDDLLDGEGLFVFFHVVFETLHHLVALMPNRGSCIANFSEHTQTFIFEVGKRRHELFVLRFLLLQASLNFSHYVVAHFRPMHHQLHGSDCWLRLASHLHLQAIVFVFGLVSNLWLFGHFRLLNGTVFSGLARFETLLFFVPHACLLISQRI